MAPDLQSLQEKYATEAQKRLRPDGLSQFQDVQQSDSTRLRHLALDTWADHAALDAQLLESPALKPGDRTKFLIAGAGIGGIVSAVRLILAGFSPTQIHLVETGGGVGGTWYWNRYPGLHCDVESYVYMPLLEEMGYMPSHKYASGIEIRKFLNQVVQRYQLNDKILFRTKLERLQWDAQDRLWRADLTTFRGPPGTQASKWAVETEFVILTAGYLSRPQVPKLDGANLDVFEGDMFHTARWDYTVTGGSDQEVFPSLEKLRGKKVGIIGTGATAVQVVPCLAKYAEELFVFQRTPSAVYSRDQRATDPTEWRCSIANSPGWHKGRMENMTAHMARSAPPGSVDLVNDEWTRQTAYAALTGDPDSAFLSPEKVPELIAFYLELDAESRAQLRARISEIISDKSTAEKLTPWYPVWCKRPTFSDTYLETFNMAHVHLIETEGRGVDGATSRGLTVRGTEYPLDVLVLATGYISPSASGGDPSARARVQVFGRGGRSMADKWETQGLTTLHGMATSGFPNLFWIGASQGPSAANLAHVIDAQSRHIAYVVGAAHEKAASRCGGGPGTTGRCIVEVETDAEDAWSLRILQGATRLAAVSVCTPGYLSNEGQGLRMALGLGEAVSQESMIKMARTAPWSGGMTSFLRELEEWRNEGKLSGFQVEVA